MLSSGAHPEGKEGDNMGLTRFPNGLTVRSTTGFSPATLGYNSAATDGDIDCNRLFVNSLVTVSTSNPGIIGEVVAVPVFFGTGSAAQVFGVAAPFAGDIIGAFVTIGSVSAVAAAYTVRVGSAGSVAVASVSNTITTSYDAESLTTTRTAFTTANGIQVTRGVQGTAGDTQLTLLLQKTA
jgi:hypothetical protein